MDGVLLASPFIGLVLALLLLFASQERRQLVVAYGALAGDRSTASVHAELLESDGPGRISGALPIGYFRVVRQVETGGWPMDARLRRSEPEVMFKIFAEGAGGARAANNTDTALLAAIDRAISADESRAREVRTRLGLRSSQLDGWSVLANIALCWLAVYIALACTMQFARFIGWRIAIRQRRRHRRAERSGFCPKCGYDLRASAWSERCPECGIALD